jgi:hypothetical protein
LPPVSICRRVRGTTSSDGELKSSADGGAASTGIAIGTLFAVTGWAIGTAGFEGGAGVDEGAAILGRGGGIFGAVPLGLALRGAGRVGALEGRGEAGGLKPNWKTVPHLGHTKLVAPLTASGENE